MMTESDVRRIVRSELRVLLASAPAMTQPPEPCPVEAWLRTLAPGTEGTASRLLEAYQADGGVEPADALRFGRRLRGLVGRLLERRRRRDGVSLYTVREPRPLTGIVEAPALAPDGRALERGATREEAAGALRGLLGAAGAEEVGHG